MAHKDHYILLTASSTEALAEQVNIKILSGWIPLGGPAAQTVKSEAEGHINLRGVDSLAFTDTKTRHELIWVQAMLSPRLARNANGIGETILEENRRTADEEKQQS